MSCVDTDETVSDMIYFLGNFSPVTDVQTDRKWCMLAHYALVQVGLENKKERGTRAKINSIRQGPQVMHVLQPVLHYFKCLRRSLRSVKLCKLFSLIALNFFGQWWELAIKTWLTLTLSLHKDCAGQNKGQHVS